MNNRITAWLVGGCCLPVFSQTPIRGLFDPVSAAKFNSIPTFTLPAEYKDRVKHPLPASADLTKSKWMPPYSGWSIQGWSCANATAVSFVYGYEAQRMLNVPSSGSTPYFPYEYTYHFLNGGNQAEGGDGWMFVEAFDILKETGAPTTADFGGFEWGNGGAGWMTGYDKYYKAMKARASEYYKIDASIAANDESIKQYLVDHADGSAEGGLLTFQINSESMPTATINGRRTFTDLGSGGGHALVICGYDDAHAGGSYMCVNNWGDGIYWAPYKLFRAGSSLATSQGTPVMFCRVRKDYSPKLTFKIGITHDSRNKIALLAGVAPTAAATAPTKTKDFAGAFNYAGGASPMAGKGMSSTIEIGLDLTDFAPLLTGKDARFFFQVVSKGGTGKINSVTLMDYTGAAVKEIPGTEPDKAIAGGSTTTVSIPWTGTVTSLRKRAQAPAAFVSTRTLDLLGRTLANGTRAGSQPSAVAATRIRVAR
ncbi:MAG: hypothetical protein JWP91_3605 [Fibrobacteres bacterium]|nr:hypothetical protein [Fibrobacterota bacterium]